MTPRLEVEPLVLAGVEVDAVSIGGLETCIHLPGHKLAFDIGRCPDRVVARDRIFFTHAHMDHMAGVAWHCATRSLRGMQPPTYYVPSTNEADFERMLDAWRVLDRSELPHTTVAIEPGQEVELDRERVVRPFHSVHTAPCQGYALWRRKRKLKAEHQGRAPDELRQLREDGVEITDPIETPEVVFTGDTRIDVVEREEVVRRARLLIMEVTFLDDRVSVEECRARGHVHLDEVLEHAELFENEAILLTHFSARYRRGEIERILATRLPPRLRERVTALLP